ncbi:MAG: tRNA preQ1(34) S-adenosylmethionine ribosyltransferase-isomerase QueA [Pseudomonadota bacterium]
MRVDLFDFELPESAIALRPAEPRDSARLLTVCPHLRDPIGDHGVLDLPSCLRPGDAVVMNDTKVIPAQLSGVRRRDVGTETIDAKISLTLHLRTAPDCWKAFARPAKKLQAGDTIVFEDLEAVVLQKAEGGEALLRFSKTGSALDKAIAAAGVVPLPPYISGKRAADARDEEDYQTIYAAKPGAVAAPTAGLHTTERLLRKLEERNVTTHTVTLHVGAGTFLPVKAEDTQNHHMHEEWGTVSEETADALNTVRRDGGRIVAMGTTSLRLLESAVDDAGTVRPFSGTTDIFITPGFRFRAIDLLMTNFHLPRSTLFMLVSAFCGLDVMSEAYMHAIKNGYRFYSYGDASLLWRADLPENLR